ncbi:MAG TPA: glycosyltransferase family 9 protein [bacterium]|nr:glycosyltransferase family 9 protein [bacterium]
MMTTESGHHLVERLYRYDCRWYRGDKSCAAGGNCAGCAEYRKIERRILIIKWGARGDNLRTTPILRALRAEWPDAQISWLTAPESLPLLQHNSLLDRVYAFDALGVAALLPQSFDLLLSLDKEPGALGMAMNVRATDKRGFAMTESGSLTVFNPASAYALRLGVDDELKFRGNRKSYPEIIFEMAEFPYRGEEFVVELSDTERARAHGRLQAWFGDGPVVGLNTGCGRVYAAKSWSQENFITLARELIRRGRHVLLLGGTDERARNEAISEVTDGRAVIAATQDNLRDLIGYIDGCAAVVTGDTLALHIAVARHVPVVALIGPTSAAELDLFGYGEKIVAARDCAPCYRAACPQPVSCMQELPPDRVLAALDRVLAARAAGR